MPFANKQWKRLITEGGRVDHRRYETAIAAMLRDGLRAGDVWVEGTRNFQRFDAYLLHTTRCRESRRAACRSRPMPPPILRPGDGELLTGGCATLPSNSRAASSMVFRWNATG